MKRILLLSFVFMVGCGYEPIAESPYVSTEDMRFSINADDSGTSAKLAILINSPVGVLKVTGDDQLRARIDGNAVPLTFTPGTFPSYDAVLGAINKNVVIDLDRSEHHGFRDVTIAMPAAFTPTAPEPAGNDPVVITWDPAPPDANVVPASMSVDIKGECIPPFQRTFDSDTGTATIAQSELQRMAQLTPCLLSVKLSRTGIATGSLLGSTAGGAYAATMVRHRQIMVTLPP